MSSLGGSLRYREKAEPRDNINDMTPPFIKKNDMTPPELCTSYEDTNFEDFYFFILPFTCLNFLSAHLVLRIS